MNEINKAELEKIVRQVLMEMAQGSGGGAQSGMVRQVDPSGIMSIKTETVKPEPFDTGKPGDRVYLKDIVSLEESPRLGFGVMEMDKSTFKWTLRYDEVDYIIDGELTIIIDGREITGQKGDIVFIPAHSTIEFSAPGFARFMYVVYPANWYEQ